MAPPSSKSVKKKNSKASPANPTPNQHDLKAVDTSDLKPILHIIHLHIRVLMCRPSATHPIPSPPTASEKLAAQNTLPDDHQLLDAEISIGHLIERTTNVVSDNLYRYIDMTLQRLGLRRYTCDWYGNYDDDYNQLSLHIFLKTFTHAVITFEYGLKPRTVYRDEHLLSAVFWHAFKNLSAAYKAQAHDPNILQERGEDRKIRMEKHSRAAEYLQFLKIAGVRREIVSIFQKKNYHIMGELEMVETKRQGRVFKERHILYPRWWSEKLLALMCTIESQLNSVSRAQIKRGPKRIPCTFHPAQQDGFDNVPPRLPVDLYHNTFVMSLLNGVIETYRMKASILPDPQQMSLIWPTSKEEITSYSKDDSFSSSDDEDASISSEIEDEASSDDNLSYSPMHTEKQKSPPTSSNQHRSISEGSVTAQSSNTTLDVIMSCPVSSSTPSDEFSYLPVPIVDPLEAMKAEMENQMKMLMAGYEYEHKVLKDKIEAERRELQAERATLQQARASLQQHTLAIEGPLPLEVEHNQSNTLIHRDMHSPWSSSPQQFEVGMNNDSEWS